MVSKVKETISQICCGKIPKGYKKTKVGIVPSEWSETRFKNMFSRISRKNTEGNDNVLTISAQYGLISQRSFFNKDIASDDKSNYFLLYKGEFAYNKSYSNGYPFGALKRLDMYDKGIVSPLYICFSATEDNKCPEFYVHYFDGGKMDREIKAFAQEGARNHGLLNISVDDFFNSYLLMPSIAEQNKIAEILSTQDKLIELNQRKIEELKKLKKYYLRKMFPRKDSNVPEIRFKGFTEPWEKRELEEYIIDYNEVTTKNNQYPALTSSRKGIFLQTEYFSGKQIASADNTGYNIVPYGYFTYRHMSDDEIFYFNINDIVENGIVSTLYPVFTTTKDLDSRYLQYQLNYGSEFSKYAILQKQGGSRTYMYLSKLKKLKLTMPASIDEQKQISKYFTTLDCLITLHQHRCEEQKKQKKSLMQLLLTGIVRVKI